MGGDLGRVVRLQPGRDQRPSERVVGADLQPLPASQAPPPRVAVNNSPRNGSKIAPATTPSRVLHGHRGAGERDAGGVVRRAVERVDDPRVASCRARHRRLPRRGSRASGKCSPMTRKISACERDVGPGDDRGPLALELHDLLVAGEAVDEHRRRRHAAATQTSSSSSGEGTAETVAMRTASVRSRLVAATRTTSVVCLPQSRTILRQAYDDVVAICRKPAPSTAAGDVDRRSGDVAKRRRRRATRSPSRSRSARRRGCIGTAVCIRSTRPGRAPRTEIAGDQAGTHVVDPDPVARRPPWRARPSTSRRRPSTPRSGSTPPAHRSRRPSTRR